MKKTEKLESIEAAQLRNVTGAFEGPIIKFINSDWFQSHAYPRGKIVSFGSP